VFWLKRDERTAQIGTGGAFRPAWYNSTAHDLEQIVCSLMWSYPSGKLTIWAKAFYRQMLCRNVISNIFQVYLFDSTAKSDGDSPAPLRFTSYAGHASPCY
jgi:hypothetical protein